MVSTLNILCDTSYVILKRVPAHERKSISRNLFTFGPMLIGTFLLKYPGKVCDKGFETSCIYIKCCSIFSYYKCIIFYRVLNIGVIPLRWWLIADTCSRNYCMIIYTFVCANCCFYNRGIIASNPLNLTLQKISGVVR